MKVGHNIKVTTELLNELKDDRYKSMVVQKLTEDFAKFMVKSFEGEVKTYEPLGRFYVSFSLNLYVYNLKTHRKITKALMEHYTYEEVQEILKDI